MTKIVFVSRKDSPQNLTAQSAMEKLMQTANLTIELQSEVAFVGGTEAEPSQFLQNRDYDRYDLLIGMDQPTLWKMYRVCGGDFGDKMFLFRNFVQYSGKKPPKDSGLTEEEIQKGCQGILIWLKKNKESAIMGFRPV